MPNNLFFRTILIIVVALTAGLFTTLWFTTSPNKSKGASPKASSLNFTFDKLNETIDQRIAEYLNDDKIKDLIRQIAQRLPQDILQEGTEGQGLTGGQGIKGISGDKGATGDQGDKGTPGEIGIATCEQGGCISRQITSPGIQESGNFNLAGSGILGENLTVDSGTLYVGSTNNRVGIGTTAPISQLQVSDGNSVNTSLITSDLSIITAQGIAPGFSIISAGTTQGHRAVFKGVRSNGTLASPTVPNAEDFVLSFLGAIYDGSITQGTALVNFTVDGAVSPGIAPQRIGFFTSATDAASRLERLTIKSNGNVGIGTTNPNSAFHVSSANFPVANIERTSTLTDQVRKALRIVHMTTGDMIDGFGSGMNFEVQDSDGVIRPLAGIQAVRNGSDLSGRLELQTSTSGITTTRLSIDSTGNVGIGTTAPDGNLEIKANSTPTVQISNANNSSNLTNGSILGNLGFAGFFNGSTNDLARIRGIYSGDGTTRKGDLTFETHNSGYTEKMRITSGGNVGIGTTAPAATLEVAALNAASQKGLVVRASANASPGNIFEVVNSGATANHFVIGPTGFIGVNTTAPSSTIMNIGGTHPGSATSLHAFGSNVTLPSTTTVLGTSFNAQITTAAASFTLGDARAINVSPPSVGAGSAITNLRGVLIGNQGATGVVNAYGLQINSQSGATTLNIGALINTPVGTAGNVAALWLGGDAAGTTEAGGIVWGSTRDVNLYRSAANTLRTDDTFSVGGNAGIGVAAPTLGGLEISGAGTRLLTLTHTSNAAEGMVLRQTAVGADSPRMFFLRNNDSSGNAIARISTGLIFTTAGTPGSATGTIRMTLDDAGQLQIGQAADTTSRVVISGGSGGTPMFTLSRTSGATIQYSWALSGGGLSFTDDTNGFITANMFGDGGINALYIGGRSKNITDARPSLLSATTFGVAAGNDVASNSLQIQGGLGTGAGTPGDILFKTGDTVASGNLQSSTTRMTIKASTGNVGIGITAPQAGLHVSSTAYISSVTPSLSGSQGKFYVVGDYNGSGDGQVQITGQTNLNKRLRLAYDTTNDLGYIQATEIGTGNKNLALNPAGGNVGIGTTGPAKILDILSTVSTDGIRVSAPSPSLLLRTTDDVTNRFPSLGFMSSTTLKYQMIADTTNNTLFIDVPAGSFRVRDSLNGGTSIFTVLQNGNVGIGTTAPNNLLEVVGGATGVETNLLQIRSNFSAANTGSGIRFVNSSNATSTSGAGEITTIRDVSNGSSMLFRTANTSSTLTERLRIDNAGNVGIGTTGPSSLLHLNVVAGSNPSFQLSDGNVAHGLTGILAGTDTTFNIGNYSSNDGGAILTGASDGDLVTGLTLQGVIGITDPTDTTPAILLNGSKKNTTLSQAMGALETVLQVETGTTGSGTKLLTILGNGNVGIGTTAPAAKLDVRGSLQTVGTTGLQSFVNFSGTLTDTANAASIGINNTVILSPTSASLAEFRAYYMSAQLTGAQSFNIAQGLYGESRFLATGDATTIMGGHFQSVLPAAAVNFGTITNAIGAEVVGLSEFASPAITSGTITNAIGLRVVSSSKTSAGLTLSNSYGILGLANTAGTNNAGIVFGEVGGSGNQSNLVLGQTSIPTGSYSIYNVSTKQNYFGGNLGIGDTAPGNTLKVVGSLCVKNAATACAGTTSGTIYATNTTVQAADVAENYISSQSLEPGDVIMPASDGNDQAVVKSTEKYQKQLIGIISTNPGVTLNSDAETDGTHPNKYPVALQGRVPVKVSTENGPIGTGDYLTSSSIPGVAMKATQPGQIIGKALEPFSNDGVGKVMTFVNVSFADPKNALAQLKLDESGSLVLPSSTVIASQSNVVPGLNGNPDPRLHEDDGGGVSILDLASRVQSLESYSSSDSASLKEKVDSLAKDVDILRGQVFSASVSATLNESTGSASLLSSSDQTTVVSDLTVTGSTNLNNLGVTGTISSGLLTVDGLNGEINTLSGALKLQSLSLGSVEIMGGKVTIDTQGNLIVQKEITAKKLNIQNQDEESAAIGEGNIKAGENEVIIKTTSITKGSRIFVTSTSELEFPLAVVSQKPGESFTVKIKAPPLTDLTFNWWVVN